MAILAFYVGLFFLVVGFVALIKGSVRKFRIGSRRQAVVLIAVALIGTGIAAAKSPQPEADQLAVADEPVASTPRPKPRQSASATPSSARKSPTARPSPSPSQVKKSPSKKATPLARASVTPKPGSAPSNTPAASLAHVVYGRRDANFGSTKRLVLEVETKQWPVTSSALADLAKALIAKERGRGWHAISITFRYDKREAIPAFGVYEWAPDGEWANADQGDPRTWKGYRLTDRLRPKLSGDPKQCSPPSEEAYVLAADFNAALERGEGDDENALLQRIGTKYGKSRAEAFDLVFGVDLWSHC